MKNLINYLSKKSLSLGNGPALDRRWTGHESGRFLSILTLFLTLFSFGVGKAWGGDAVYKTAKFGSSYNSTSVSNYTSSWYSTNNGFRVNIVNGNNNSNKWTSVKFGRSGVASVGTITTNAGIAIKVTKVTINISSISSADINSITLAISSNGSSWTDVGTYTKSAGSQTVEIPAVSQDNNLYYKLTFDCANTGSSNGLIEISQVDYYADESNFDKYTLVTDASALSAGDEIVFGASSYNAVASSPSGTFLTSVSGTFNDGTLFTSGALEFTLSKSGNNWIFNNSTNQLRAASSSSLALTNSGGCETWTISISSNDATITSTNASYGVLYYNSGSPRFKNYTSAQAALQIYKKVPPCDDLGAVNGDVSLTKTTRTMTASWPTTEDGNETGYSVQLYDNNGTGVKGSAIGDPVAITGTSSRTHTFTGLTPNHEYFVGVTPTYDGDGDFCEKGTEVTNNATTDAGYTVTYAKGTGATGTMTDSNSPYDAGATVTVLTNTFENCGAIFNAWSAKKADETAIDVSSGSFTMPASNVTITATWTNKQDKFYDYMHENHPGGSDYYSRSGAYTTPAALDNTTPGDGCEGKHYKFMGWVEADYINEDGTLKDGFTLIPASQSGHCADGKTFYAIWAEEE